MTTPEKLADRIFARADDDGDCLVWTGAKNRPDGYGVIGWRVGGKQYRAYVHRLVYEGFNGAIPADHEIHHCCGNRLCVNPDHLEVVTDREHGLRHRTAVEQRGVPCPHCGSDSWRHNLLRGRPNGWRCADCHARRERARSRTEVTA